MAFILTKDPNFGTTAYKDYRKYLQENRPKFPQSLWKVAASDWYYAPEDPRCPHDSRLENLLISNGKQPKHKGNTSILLKLRNAYGNKYITYSYSKVSFYSLQCDWTKIKYGHACDWLLDEFRLSKTGLLCHEIEWDRNRWLIEAGSIKCSWMTIQRD